MIHGFLKSTLAICLVLLLFAPSIVANPDENSTQTAKPAPDKSKIWGWWPLVPWDKQPVASPSWADVLNRPLDLTRKGKPGQKLVYQVKRINLSLDRKGKVLNRMVAEAQLSRTLVREAELGVWVERCIWERFAMAQGMGPNDYPEPQELANARGISFEFMPRTFDYINPPADFARVGNEVAGYLLKVLTMDATGWDAVLLSIRDEFGGKVRIGDGWRQTEWEPWDITRVKGEGTAGRYQVGEMQVSVVGLTRFRGEPCLLIWISMEGNDVTQKMDTPQLSLNMQSTEYFRGEIAASLLDGHLVAMELWGPLPCIMEMGFGGKPAAEQPIGTIIQQVSMWEVSPAPHKEK